jgi:hypothetical protein
VYSTAVFACEAFLGAATRLCGMATSEGARGNDGQVLSADGPAQPWVKSIRVLARSRAARGLHLMRAEAVLS